MNLVLLKGPHMRRLRYLVRIAKESESDWGASVPDLPGCVATGKTVDSALRRIRGAIELHLRGLWMDGIPTPRPHRRAVLPKKRSRQMELYTTVDPFPPNVDWDSAALSYHPKFVRIIEKSRADIAAGRTMSMEEMKRAVLPQRSLKRRPGRATRKGR